jgi:Domain of unknown function (DUF4832)
MPMLANFAALIFSPARNPARLGVVGSVIVLAGSAMFLPASELQVTVKPALDNAMLINPGKGWLQYGWPNEKYTRTMIGLGYIRFNWAELEPEEGRFNWQPVEDAIARFGSYGKKLSCGVMNASVHTHGRYVTPKWVFDAGAQPHEYWSPYWKKETQIVPKNWQDDQVFFAKMHDFIAAFGKRYDGNPALESIDIRSYGNWGEGHLGSIPNGKELISATPEILRHAYVEPYFAAFHKTRLIIPWGNATYNSVYDWATQQGAGMRRDGILSQWSADGSECFRSFGHAPATFEFCWNYQETKAKGYWKPDLLLKSIRAGKPSYLQWYDDLYEENQDLCQQIGNLLGYHFVLKQVTYPSEFALDRGFSVACQWLNDGVAPLYEPAVVSCALLDAHGKVSDRCWLPDVKPQTWLPDQISQFRASVRFPKAIPGTYRLALGIFTSQNPDAEVYRIGNQGRTADGWYVLGEISCR